MEKANIAIEIHYRLAIEFQDHAQHAVSGRMLRPHVENHLGAIEQSFSGCGDFYLMHSF
jgi:hypothetical protein